MLMEKERQQIVDYGNKLISSGLTRGTGGNLSILASDRGAFAITPSGLPYDLTRPEDIVVMDLEGKILQGGRKPSSEHDLHRLMYRKRPDVFSIIHAHTRYSTALSCLGTDLPRSHYLAAIGGMQVRLAGYAPFGTVELAENAVNTIGGNMAVLMANHGILTVGPSLYAAFLIAEQLEYCSEVYCIAASVGSPVLLTDEQHAHNVAEFSKLLK